MESRPGTANGTDAENQGHHIKELHKSIRNVTKKLNATAKVDSIIAANPNVSLDELLASKKINQDQKAQALKKPSLQASLAQLEEQLTQFKKIDADHQARLQFELDKLKQAHQQEIDSLKKTTTTSHHHAGLREDLLVFSQFLRAAAAKRLVENEVDSEESKAFEGALLLVYGGDDRAVDAAENLIRGSDDRVISVEGHPLNITYSQVKQVAMAHAAASASDNLFSDPDATPHAGGQDDHSTLNHDAHTETDALRDYQTAAAATSAAMNHTDADQVNGLGSAIQSSAQDSMANAMGSQLAAGSEPSSESDPLDESFEIVPRPREETMNPHEPAQQRQTTSWADDAAAEMPIITTGASSSAPKPMAADDGFHEVAHRRGGRGQHGHHAPRGDHPSRSGRGRGGPGEGRGRGRGGPRGDHHHRGSFHGERRGGAGRGPRGGHPAPPPPATS